MGKCLPSRNTAYNILQEIVKSFALEKFRAEKNQFFFERAAEFYNLLD